MKQYLPSELDAYERKAFDYLNFKALARIDDKEPKDLTNFGADREDGEIQELLVKSLILKWKSQASIEMSSDTKEQPFKEWDLSIQLVNRSFTIESKFDAGSCKTPNFAIEFESNGPSGIAATKSDLWIHGGFDRYKPILMLFSVRTDELRKLIESRKWPIWDGPNSSCHLIVKSYIRSLPSCRRIL